MNGNKKPIKEAVDSAQQLWTAGVDAITKAQEESNRVLESLVKEGQEKATQQWDKLEQVFEDRVARALRRLGVPTNKDIQQLTERIEQLSATLAELNGKQTRKKPATPAKPATRMKKTTA